MAAPTPVIRTLVDSYNDIIVKVSIPSGGDADIAATAIIDISTFTTGRTVTSCSIRRITWSLDGFAVNLFEDADTDVRMCTMATGTGDLKLATGISTTGATGSVGDIVFTTTGVGTADTGFFIVHATKGTSTT